MIDRKKVIEELETCLTASCRGKSGYCPIPDEIWGNLDEVLELLKDRSRDYETWAKEIGVHTCVNCKRYYSATEYSTDCPIMNVYAVPKDGYCHLWEPEDWRADDE